MTKLRIMKITKTKKGLTIDGEGEVTINISTKRRLIELEGFDKPTEIKLKNFTFIGDTTLVPNVTS